MESLASAFESVSTILIQKDGKRSLKCVWAVSKKGDPEGNEEALVTVTVLVSTQTLGCARCPCNQRERSGRGTGRTRTRTVKHFVHLCAAVRQKGCNILIGGGKSERWRMKKSSISANEITAARTVP